MGRGRGAMGKAGVMGRGGWGGEVKFPKRVGMSQVFQKRKRE